MRLGGIHIPAHLGYELMRPDVVRIEALPCEREDEAKIWHSCPGSENLKLRIEALVMRAKAGRVHLVTFSFREELEESVRPIAEAAGFVFSRKIEAIAQLILCLGGHDAEPCFPGEAERFAALDRARGLLAGSIAISPR